MKVKIMTLGFTGVPSPDLLADIRIANLLVCPGRGWLVGEQATNGNGSLICTDNLEPRSSQLSYPRSISPSLSG